MVTQRNITVATIHTTSVVVSIIQTYSSCTLYFHYYLSARPRVLFTHSLTNVNTGLSESKVAKLRQCSAWLRSVYYILQMCRSVYTVEAVLEHISWNTFPGHHHAIIQSLLLDGRIQSWEMTWLIWSMVGRERECNQSVNDVIHFLLSIVVGEMYNWYFVITSAIQGCGPDGFIVLPLNDRTILFL